jgi:DNA-binding NarL/FixJ family response regulator
MANVILVDDHKSMLSGLSLLLKDLGHEVIGVATNGREFLKLLQNIQPDIVLMDIEMPVLNGIEASKEALKLFPDINIIILSMYNDEEFYNSLIEIGVKGFILKESDHDEIERAINSVVAGKHYFSQELLIKLLHKKKEINQLSLTPREIEVLNFLCKGLSSAEIADKLFLSCRTVEKMRSELLQKTNTTNSISLAIYAVKNNLVEI